MPTRQDLRTAERIRDRILEAAGDAVERIVFYGSRATGRPRPSSDYDILVVARDPVPDWIDASLRLSGLFDTFDRSVDVEVFGRTVRGVTSRRRHGCVPGGSPRGAAVCEARPKCAKLWFVNASGRRTTVDCIGDVAGLTQYAHYHTNPRIPPGSRIL